MNLGFSYIGVIYLVMLFIPNIMWSKRKPEEYDKYVLNEKKGLLLFERTGEVLVTSFALIFSDFNIRSLNLWSMWFAISIFMMLLYEIYWVKYFKTGKTMQDFYRGFCGIPLAGATLPVMSFFLLGVYGSNIWMIIATIILGIGHIGIHKNHYYECHDRKKVKIKKKIIHAVVGMVFILVFGAISVVIGVRDFRYLKHYKYMRKGIDEGKYIEIGGQKQYILMRGENKSNPVIIYLHGGPSSPDTYVTYMFSDELTDDYTFIAWDQRGCGRTYFNNYKEDKNNNTATFKQAEKDLDELVDYACKKFNKDKIIIMGHSYGTILGSEYAKNHPDKVEAYIGVAQVTSLEKTDIYNYNDALKRAEDTGKSTEKLVDAYNLYQYDSSLENLMNLRKQISKYHSVHVKDSETWQALTSPYFGVDDFKWFLKQIGKMEDYFELNSQLFDYTLGFDSFAEEREYEMPVYFISGSDDYICPVDSVREYLDFIKAENKNLFIMKGCGHNTQYARPKEFARIVKSCLR